MRSKRYGYGFDAGGAHRVELGEATGAFGGEAAAGRLAPASSAGRRLGVASEGCVTVLRRYRLGSHRREVPFRGGAGTPLTSATWQLAS